MNNICFDIKNAMARIFCGENDGVYANGSLHTITDGKISSFTLLKVGYRKPVRNLLTKELEEPLMEIIASITNDTDETVMDRMRNNPNYMTRIAEQLIEGRTKLKERERHGVKKKT